MAEVLVKWKTCKLRSCQRLALSSLAPRPCSKTAKGIVSTRTTIHADGDAFLLTTALGNSPPVFALSKSTVGRVYAERAMRG